MAGNAIFESEGRERKVASFVRAAEDLAHTQADTYDSQPNEYLMALAERLAGRLGQPAAIETWGAMRHLAHELSGINHGTPSVQTQFEVIGRLFAKVMADDFYAENPDRAFAGLPAVPS